MTADARFTLTEIKPAGAADVHLDHGDSAEVATTAIPYGLEEEVERYTGLLRMGEYHDFEDQDGDTIRLRRVWDAGLPGATPTLDEQEADALNRSEGVQRTQGHGINE